MNEEPNREKRAFMSEKTAAVFCCNSEPLCRVLVLLRVLARKPAENEVREASKPDAEFMRWGSE